MKIRVVLSLSCLAFLLAINSTALAQTSSSAAIPSKSSTEASFAANFGKLPLSFEVNQGQSDSTVKFLSHGNGYSLFLTDSAAVLVLSKAASSSNSQTIRKNLPDNTRSVVEDVIRMELPGARTNLQVSGSDQLPGRTNYFIGKDPSKWRSGISTYAKVRYEDIYPGVDLVYYGNQRQLEYDFVVAPHASPRSVRLHFAGAQHLSLTPDGDLTIKGKNGEIVFHKPVVYQLKDGLREPVPGRFQLLTRNNVRFTIGSYDRDRELVIDPALAYSTYLGGSGGESGNAIAVDVAGNVYVVGGTLSTDFPVTANAFQKVNNGFQAQPPGGGYYLTNAFVTKFNSRGSELIYSTYLGGDTAEVVGNYSGDAATGVAVDAGGNAYVTGYASAYNFPVTDNAYQKVNNAALTYNGSWNSFVTKLNPTGSSLIYSTYLGGSGNFVGHESNGYGDSTAGIAVDSSGSAYVVGTAASLNFPVTANAFQQGNNAGFNYDLNLFVTKFNPAGSALVYSTYLGGSGNGFSDFGGQADSAGGIAIDSAGHAYVTGTAYSGDFPVTANAFQKTNKAFFDNQCECGGSNAIVAELNAAGSALVYSTYLGGSTQDGGAAIALNAAGNAYVTGITYSTDFPVTPHAFQTVRGDIFIAKLNPSGSALVYSTLFGGSRYDSASSIALDAFGSAYITGTTTSTNLPVTPDAFRKANHMSKPYAITGNAFLSKLDPTGSTLLYSSYLGGSGDQGGPYAGDNGNGIAVDWFGDAYITGLTCSTDFPLASVPFQTKNKGTGCTAFMSKFIVNTVTGTRLVSNENPVKAGSKVTFTATVTPNTGSTVSTGSVVFSLDETPQVTVPLNASGQASYSNSTLTAGRHTITAVYSGSPTIAGSSANFGLTAIGAPARITVASGNNQSTAVNTSFPEPLVVQVQDANGVPVPGTVVTFTSSSGVSWSANPVLTGAIGRASVTVTYDTGGSKTVTASADHVSIPATFVETVNWSDRITIVSGNNQTTVAGTNFPEPLVVQVTNANGVPLPGQVVNFAGTALSKNPAVTDANGRVSVTATAVTEGSITVTAWTNHTPVAAIFNLTSTLPAP